MRWIQHTARRKNLGNYSNGSCASLGVQVSHTAFDAFNIQEPAALLCSADFRIIAQLGIVSDCRRERDVCFRTCWAAASPWFFQEWKLYIFISLLRTSQCWMLFEWSLNSWKRTNVFSKWLIYQLIFHHTRTEQQAVASFPNCNSAQMFGAVGWVQCWMQTEWAAAKLPQNWGWKNLLLWVCRMDFLSVSLHCHSCSITPRPKAEESLAQEMFLLAGI